MNPMRNFYISRVIIALIFGALFIMIGAQWWMGITASTIALLGFLWAPRSGRYVKQVGADGQTRLAHDEHTRSITDKAARNGFVTGMISLAAINLYYWKTGFETVPIELTQFVLIVGAITYAVSDIFIRRGAGFRK